MKCQPIGAKFTPLFAQKPPKINKPAKVDKNISKTLGNRIPCFVCSGMVPQPDILKEITQVSLILPLISYPLYIPEESQEDAVEINNNSSEATVRTDAKKSIVAKKTTENDVDADSQKQIEELQKSK